MFDMCPCSGSCHIMAPSKLYYYFCPW